MPGMVLAPKFQPNEMKGKGGGKGGGKSGKGKGDKTLVIKKGKGK